MEVAGGDTSHQYDLSGHCANLTINSGYKIFKSHGTDAFRIVTDNQLCLLQVYTKTNIVNGLDDTVPISVEGSGLGLTKPEYLLFDEELRIFRIKLNGQNLEIYFLSYFDLMDNDDLEFKLLKTQSIAHLGDNLSIGKLNIFRVKILEYLFS